MAKKAEGNLTKEMKTKIRRSVATLVNETRSKAIDQIQRFTVRATAMFWMLILFIQPAAAAHDNLPCEVPSNLEPLFALLDTFTQLAFLGGVGLATLGFSVAGLLLIMPGMDNSQLGRKGAKNVLIGTILLLSANMVVAFLVNELGTTICT